MKNKKGFSKKAVALAALVLMLVMLPLNVLAAIPQDVSDIRAGVVRIVGTTGGKQYTGTGFAVGTDANNYVIITNHHVIKDENGDMRAEYYAHYSKNESDRVPVSVLASSAGRDLAILVVHGTIPGIEPLNLSLATVLVGIDVYALGFPGENDKGDTLDSSAEAMTVTEGVTRKVLTMYTIGDATEVVNVVFSSVKTTSGNSGGPLVNSAGSVVGVHTGSGTLEDEQVSLSVHVEELISYLDSNGVAYTTTGVAGESPDSSSSPGAPPFGGDVTDSGNSAVWKWAVGLVVVVGGFLLLMNLRKKNIARGLAQSGQPQIGRPQSGQYQTGQPQVQPQYGQPQVQPQYGQPQVQPQYGQPQVQPQYGQPQVQPQYGQPQVQPQYGQPQVQPQYEHPPMQNQYVPPSAPQTAQQGMPYAVPPVAQQPYPPQGTPQPIVPPGGTGDGK